MYIKKDIIVKYVNEIFIIYFFNKWLLNILYQPGILQLQNNLNNKKKSMHSNLICNVKEREKPTIFFLLSCILVRILNNLLYLFFKKMKKNNLLQEEQKNK